MGFRLILVAFCLFCVECQFATADEKDNERLVVSQNAMAIDGYEELRQGEGNRVFSPYSLWIANAIVAEATAGETKRQFLDLLQREKGEKLLSDLKKQSQQLIPLRSKKEQNQSVFRLQNSLWIQHGIRIRNDYRQQLKKAAVAAFPIDLLRNPQAAALNLNRWMSRESAGKFVGDVTAERLSQNVADYPAAFYVLNTMYFMAEWKTPFRAAATKPKPFWVSAETSIEHPLMFIESNFLLIDEPEYQVLKLPYNQADFEFVIMLPRARNGLADLEKQLSSELIAEWNLAFTNPVSTLPSFFGKPPETEQQKGRFVATSGLVELSLPRFSLSANTNWKPLLKRLGLVNAFDPKIAEITALIAPPSVSGRAYLQEIQQLCVVKVDEQGTRVSAKTKIQGGFGGSPKKVAFRADHPFLFFIRHQPTNLIIVLGRCVDPRGNGNQGHVN